MACSVDLPEEDHVFSHQELGGHVGKVSDSPATRAEQLYSCPFASYLLSPVAGQVNEWA